MRLATISGIAALMMSFAVHAAPLVPMPQYFDSATQSVLDGTFVITEPKFTAYIAGSETASIITPDGSTVTNENASSHGFEWAVETGSDGESLVTISTSSAVTGSYRFSVTPVSESVASFSVIEDPSIQFRVMMGVEGEQIVAGKPFSVVGIAYFDHEPATEGSLQVTIQDPGGRAIASLTPLDDGSALDPVADDGAYSDVTIMSQPGQYKAVVEFSWNGKKGLIVHPFVVKNESVSASLSGRFDGEGLDNNGNGLIDVHRLTFEEDAVRTVGDYAFTVEISDASGEFVTATRVISDPSESVWIDVPVDKLKRLGPQPWKVSKVYAWKDDAVAGMWFDFGELTPDKETFERPAARLFVVDDRGIDADGDGLFETLQVIVQADVLFGGAYGLSGDLRNADGKLVGSVGISEVLLSKGGNEITLGFSGETIGSAGGDGPFRLTNILIYPNFSSSQELARLISQVGETGSYDCDDFIGCGSDVAHKIRVIAGGLCKKHQHSVMKRLRRIEVMSKRNAQVRDIQLDTLLHRVVVLEKSGSCPQANGFTGDKG